MHLFDSFCFHFQLPREEGILNSPIHGISRDSSQQISCNFDLILISSPSDHIGTQNISSLLFESFNNRLNSICYIWFFDHFLIVAIVFDHVENVLMSLVDHKRCKFIDEKFDNRYPSKFILPGVIHKRFHSKIFPFLLKLPRSVFQINFLGNFFLQQKHKFWTIPFEKPRIELGLINVIVNLPLSILTPFIPKCPDFRIILTICDLTIMTRNCVFVFSLKTLESFHLPKLLLSPLSDPSFQVDISPDSETNSNIEPILFDMDFLKIISDSCPENFIFDLFCKIVKGLS